MRRFRFSIVAFTALVLSLGCGPTTSAPAPSHGKADGVAPAAEAEGRSGWASDNSYEVDARLTSQIVHRATGAYSGLATDVVQQRELAETQVKYVRNAMKARPWEYYLEQLPREITIDSVTVDGDLVTIDYTAEVDLVHKRSYYQPVPALEDLSQTRFDGLVVPHDPIDVYRVGYSNRLGTDCADDYGDYILKEHKYYYYFTPEKEGCKERMQQLDIYYDQASLEIVEVYPTPTVYPEYDKLANDLDSMGTVGFSAAIIPNLGDSDPSSRFDAHKSTLDNKLGLTGTSQDSGRYWRYVWTEGAVQITVDLYDPTQLSWPMTFSSNFHQALGAYQLVFYNGHSNYGHKDLLSKEEAYLDAYQIIVMHSCSSYAYYAQQVFRAHASDAADATEDEQRGWATADVLATGKSSYPSDSPVVMGIILEGLMDGLVAIAEGRAHDAPSWQKMTKEMNTRTSGYILYGVAGSRTNVWRPN